jgi:hypothetical protein
MLGEVAPLQSATGLAARLASTCQSKGTNQGKYAREPSGQSGVYRECESNLSTYPPDLPTQFCTVAPVRKKIDQDFSTPPAAVISRVGRGSRGQEDGVAAGTAAVHRALAKYARRTLIVHLSDLTKRILGPRQVHHVRQRAVGESNAVHVGPACIRHNPSIEPQIGLPQLIRDISRRSLRRVTDKSRLRASLRLTPARWRPRSPRLRHVSPQNRASAR